MQLTQIVESPSPVGTLIAEKRIAFFKRTTIPVFILLIFSLTRSAFGDQAALASPVSTGDGSWAWSNPLPQGNDLLGVSCPAANFCVAVGTRGTIITYDGAGWTGIPLALPSQNDNLTGVSCPTTSYCLAVSGLGNLVRYSGGTWAIVPGVPQNTNHFNGVSCLAADNCLLVGLGPGNKNNLYLFSGTGTFQLITLSDGGATYRLKALSCASGSFCVAAATGGYYYTYLGNPSATLTIAQNSGFDLNLQSAISVSCTSNGQVSCVMAGAGGHGASYSAGAWTPTSQVPNTNFYAVFCLSFNNCLGGGDDNGSPQVARLLSFNGQWSTGPAIPPYNEIFGISCAGPNFCLAVGANGLIEKYAGSAWSPFPAVPVAVSTNLFGVSCPATTQANIKCVTVGTLNGNTFIATFDGLNWTRLNSPVVNGVTLYGVSCIDALNCMAVGSSGTIFTELAGTWSSVSQAVTGASNTTSFGGVSCLNNLGLFCIAVGSSGSILKYSGGVWSNSTSGSNALFGVDCRDTTHCFAVGSSGTILQFNGTTWTAVPTGFQGSANPTYKNVSCSSNSSCRAGGQDISTSQKFIAGFNGTSWNIDNQPAAYNGSWNGMACPVDTICYAVGNGDINTNLNNIATLASGWRLSNSGTFTVLNGVSCAGPLYCIAVGVNGTILVSEVVVRLGSDNGLGDTLDTLSYALRYSQAGQTITFRLRSDANNSVVFSGSLNYNLKPNVGLDGGDCTGTSPIDIDGTSQTGNGLVVSGGNNLRHLKIHGFGGQQISAGITGGSSQANSLQCMVASKT